MSSGIPLVGGRPTAYPSGCQAAPADHKGGWGGLAAIGVGAIAVATLLLLLRGRLRQRPVQTTLRQTGPTTRSGTHPAVRTTPAGGIPPAIHYILPAGSRMRGIWRMESTGVLVVNPTKALPDWVVTEEQAGLIARAHTFGIEIGAFRYRDSLSADAIGRASRMLQDLKDRLHFEEVKREYSLAIEALDDLLSLLKMK